MSQYNFLASISGYTYKLIKTLSLASLLLLGLPVICSDFVSLGDFEVTAQQIGSDGDGGDGTSTAGEDGAGGSSGGSTSGGSTSGGSGSGTGSDSGGSGDSGSGSGSSSGGSTGSDNGTSGEENGAGTTGGNDNSDSNNNDDNGTSGGSGDNSQGDNGDDSDQTDNNTPKACTPKADWVKSPVTYFESLTRSIVVNAPCADSKAASSLSNKQIKKQCKKKFKKKIKKQLKFQNKSAAQKKKARKKLNKKIDKCVLNASKRGLSVNAAAMDTSGKVHMLKCKSSTDLEQAYECPVNLINGEYMVAFWASERGKDTELSPLRKVNITD